MRVNYGRQEFYRRHGTEPACASCEHFEARCAPKERDLVRWWCSERQRGAAPGGICTSYERAAGAD